MANTIGEASAIYVPELVEDDRVSDWTQLVHGPSLAKPLGPESGRELANATEEKHEQDRGSEARSAQRWLALDRLLRVSFGQISPAYLFTSFPPLR